MFTEQHFLNNPYNNHRLSRTVSGFDVTTVDCSADKTSGWYGATVNLEPKTVPSTQRFSGWSATGATIENSAFTLTADATAQANFETSKTVTRQTDGHGTLGTTKTRGFINETASLTPVPNQGYAFSGYTITGATLTANTFTFTGSNVTAKAWFSASMDYVTIGTAKWLSTNLAIDDGGTGIYHQTVNYGQGNVTEYYYTYAAALRVANSLDGWHLPNLNDWGYLLTQAGASTAGKALKSTYGWKNSKNGTDAYGFAAFPAGYYSNDYTSFYGTGSYVDYWESGMANSTAAYYREMYGADSVYYYYKSVNQGCLVRLVKDA